MLLYSVCPVYHHFKDAITLRQTQTPDPLEGALFSGKRQARKCMHNIQKVCAQESVNVCVCMHKQKWKFLSRSLFLTLSVSRSFSLPAQAGNIPQWFQAAKTSPFPDIPNSQLYDSPHYRWERQSLVQVLPGLLLINHCLSQCP